MHYWCNGTTSLRVWACKVEREIKNCFPALPICTEIVYWFLLLQAKMEIGLVHTIGMFKRQITLKRWPKICDHPLPHQFSLQSPFNEREIMYPPQCTKAKNERIRILFRIFATQRIWIGAKARYSYNNVNTAYQNCRICYWLQLGCVAGTISAELIDLS